MAEQSIIPFLFDNQAIRVTDADGAPWFVAADVCGVLGLSNPSVAVKPLDEDEKAKLNLGFGSDATVINESGLFTLILRCRDAMTPGTIPYRFRKWVTGEVLPTIRKTGSYGVSDVAVALSDPAQLRSLLLANVEKVLALESRVAEMRPSVDAFQRIAEADGSLCVTDTAKALQVRPKDLFSRLQADHWIYRRTGGKGWLGYQSKVQSGLVEHKVETIQRPDGSEAIREQVRITPKGLARLAEQFSASA